MPANDRRNFLASLLTLGSAAVAIPFMGAAQPSESKPLPSLKGKKVLFTSGGWPGHEPEKFETFWVPWLKEQGADVHSSPSLDGYADKTLMASVDLVLQIYTMSQITKEQEAGLLEAVKVNGTGIAGWHGGLCDSFRNNPDYQYMTGGQWVAHPGGVVDYTVSITDQKDEVTRGLKSFKIKSEQYYMHIDPNVKVLATTKFNGAVDPWIDGAVMPVTWKKMYGKGRVFYTSLGHSLTHLQEVPESLEMLKRGIQWASGSKQEAAEKWLQPVYKS